MLRKMTCAVVGITLACAAGYALSLIARLQAPADLDLRWIQTAAKQDRLPIDPDPGSGGVVVSFDLPSQSTTVVTKSAARPAIESAVWSPRPTPVRTVPIRPVREMPNEEAQKERLPEGCDPAFSPVTTPALAHISVRCDS